MQRRVEWSQNSSMLCRQGGALGGAASAAALARQREQEAEADQARKRFGNAKSISSAQFNSNEDSNAVDYEKQVCAASGFRGCARVCARHRVRNLSIWHRKWVPLQGSI